MRVQDLDVSSSAAGTDEFIITNPTTHKSERISFANMLASISTLANLVITTLFKVTGDTELKDTSIVGDVDITGDTSITGDLEVNGDIIQRGSAYETHAEKVYTRDDVINLRDGAISALGANEYAGVIAKHYDTQGHDGALVFDKTGEGRVGDYTVSEVKVYSSDGTTFYSDEEMTEAAVIPSGVTPAATGVENEYSYTVTEDDTEPIMTRDEAASMTDKALIVWDAANRKAKTAGVPNVANLVPVSNANGGFSWGSYNPVDDLVPIGITLPWFSSTMPSARWHIADGSSFNTTDYPELALIFPLGKLPDLRECVLVGAGKNTTNVFDSTETNPNTQAAGTQAHDEYAIGEFKDDQMQWHRHKLAIRSKAQEGISNAYPYSGLGGGNTSMGQTTYTYEGSYLANKSYMDAIDGRSGTTTHGKQIGCNFIVRMY